MIEKYVMPPISTTAQMNAIARMVPTLFCRRS
jgi:hypothetical protein